MTGTHEEGDWAKLLDHSLGLLAVGRVGGVPDPEAPHAVDVGGEHDLPVAPDPRWGRAGRGWAGVAHVSGTNGQELPVDSGR